MDNLSSEELDEIIERMVKDLEVIKIDSTLSAVLASAFKARRSFRCMFCRFRFIVPVAGTHQVAMLYADMGTN